MCTSPGLALHGSVGPFPHWRELVETCPGEDSPQDKVSCFESARADVAAVVATEVLLVPCCSKGRIAAEPFKQQKVVVAEFVQLSLLEGQDSRGAMRDLAGEDSFSAVDEGDRKSTRLNSSHITRSRMPSSA